MQQDHSAIANSAALACYAMSASISLNKEEFPCVALLAM